MDFLGIKVSHSGKVKLEGAETLNQAELEKEPLLRKARWFSDRNRTYKAVQCFKRPLSAS